MEDWDPQDRVKHWLRGADTLHFYDEQSSQLLELLERKVTKEILAIALESIAASGAGKIAFFLQNHRSPIEISEAKYRAEIVARAPGQISIAENLLRVFDNFGDCPRRQV